MNMMTYQKKINSRLIGLFFAILTLIGALYQSDFSAFAVVNPSSSFYVTDESEVLSRQTKEHILKINHQFEETVEKPQIAVVVVPTLDGTDIETYAVKQFEKMQLGNRAYDNGLLILLATEDKEIRIEVGYGLEGALPDAKVGRIIDASLDDLVAGDYSTAIEAIFDQLVLAVQDEYGYEDVFNGNIAKVEVLESDTLLGDEELSSTVTLIGGVIFIALYFIVCFIFGIHPINALFIILQILGSGSGGGPRGGSSSRNSSGGGGRSGGGGASRNF